MFFPPEKERLSERKGNEISCGGACVRLSMGGSEKSHGRDEGASEL
jgi:hypothetical protein